MKHLLLISLLTFAPSLWAATYPALSCSETDVQNAYNTEQASKADGDVITIPAGTCTWTTTLTISPTNSLTFQGAGAESATSGGSSTTGTDQTIITVNENSWFNLTTSTGKLYRITGLAISKPNGNPCCSGSGSLTINGTSTAVRVDHNHFTWAVTGESIAFIGGSIVGVADHNVLDDTNINPWFQIENGRAWILSGTPDPNGTGDYSWADADYWGSSKFFFLEDNRLNNNGGTGGYINDCSVGGREVIRHNTLNVLGIVQAHEFSGDFRGCREGEVYQNTYLNSTEAGAAVGTRSGSVLVWGNILQQMKQLVTPQQDRTNQLNGTFANSYGQCGNGDPANGFVGTVNTSGTSVTWVSGVQFPTIWPNESFPLMFINGTSFVVSSCSTGTSCTLATSAGTQTGVSYVLPSVWDGNHDTTGYPCLDQPGRGQGDKLAGSFSSSPQNRTNSATSQPSPIDSGNNAWPREALDPVYVWDNINTWPGDSSAAVVATNANVMQDNRDWYQQMAVYCNGPAHNSCGENPSGTTLSPGGFVTFTGAAGIGCGPNTTTDCPNPVARPATCTAGTDPVTSGSAPGVGYWDNTNATASIPGTLYVCNPTNTWTAYYTPYTYPNPLTQTNAVSVSGVTIKGASIQ